MDRLVVSAFGGVCMMNTAFVSVPFLYRYFYLCRAIVHDNRLILKLSMAPVLIGIGCGVAFFSNWERTELDELTRSTLYHAGWRFNDGLFHVFRGYMTNPSTATAIGLCILSLSAVYVIILWTEYKVLRRLQFHGRGMRLSTRKVHADINRALIALALCPLFSADPSGSVSDVLLLPHIHRNAGSLVDSD
ncbi:hypothetical protein AAVH_14569 [Aphelenchoides avenae]|nr:hypothetical protein AAVH_14569 [Aphelenchus avenae]